MAVALLESDISSYDHPLVPVALRRQIAWWWNNSPEIRHASDQKYTQAVTKLEFELIGPFEIPEIKANERALRQHWHTFLRAAHDTLMKYGDITVTVRKAIVGSTKMYIPVVYDETMSGNLTGMSVIRGTTGTGASSSGTVLDRLAKPIKIKDKSVPVSRKQAPFTRLVPGGYDTFTRCVDSCVALAITPAATLFDFQQAQRIATLNGTVTRFVASKRPRVNTAENEIGGFAAMPVAM